MATPAGRYLVITPSQDLNSAAVFLLDHGADLEAEVAAEAEAMEAEEGGEGGGTYTVEERSVAPRGGGGGGEGGGGGGEGGDNFEEHSGRSEVEEGEVSGGVLPMKTVSFRPGAAVGRSFRPRAGHQSAPPQRRNIDALEIIDGVEAFDAAFDEFVSAAPPPPPLPEESGLAAASRAGVSVLLLSNTKASQRAALPISMPPLSLDFCLPGRLLRPVPLAANRNCVVHSADRQGRVLVASRHLETDVMSTAVRPMESCQRPEAGLAAHFSELRQLGANSSGLSAVSGAAP